MALSVSEAVASRRSCRKFLEKEVSIDLVMKILDEARYAPSSSNLQPWKIYLIHGETKKKLAQIVQTKCSNGQFVDLPCQFQVWPGVPVPFPMFVQQFYVKYPTYAKRYKALGKSVYTSQGVERGDLEARKKAVIRAFDFFGAPVGLLLTVDKDAGYGQYPDLGIMLQTIMLLCEQYGLNTCTQLAWSLQHKTVRNVLNIDQNETIFCGMCIGYKDPNAKVNQFKRERMELDEMVVVPEIVDDPKLPSKTVFQLRFGVLIAKHYLSRALPLIAIGLGAVAIGVAYCKRGRNRTKNTT
eukprot:110275_1